MQVSLNDKVARLLALGRTRLKERRGAEEAERRRRAEAADAHWVNLHHVIAEELDAFGLKEYYDFSLARPGVETNSWYLRLEIPLVGEIARRYSFVQLRGEQERSWRPCHRVYSGKDANWGAVTYHDLPNETGHHVGARLEDDWNWFEEFPDALADAEIQRVERDRLIFEAERLNKEWLHALATGDVVRSPATTTEALANALVDFIKEQVGDELGKSR